MAGLSGTHWLTWANGLTVARLLAAVPLFCALVARAEGVAFLIFWLAVASDLVDGRIARARGETSALGGVLDHATDAIFVTCGLVALARSGQAPLLLPFLVIGAFVQYVVDSKALAGRSLRASAVGRWNGIFYFVPIGTVVTRDVLGWSAPSDGIVLVIGWALVVSTLASMADRLWALVKRAATPDIEG